MHRKLEHLPAEVGDDEVVRALRARTVAARSAATAYGPQIRQQRFRALQRLGLGLFEPGKIVDVVDAGGLERQDDLGEIEALHLGQFLQRTLCVLALRPEAHANTRRRAPGAAGALVGRGHGNLLDQQRVDAAVRIETRHARQAAIHDHRHAVDGQRGFGDVGRHDDLARVVAGDGAVLLIGRQFAVERKTDEAAQGVRTLDVLHRAADLVRARHEDKDVALRLRGHALAFARGHGPDRIVFEIHRFGQVLHLHRKSPALRGEHFAGSHVLLELRRIERGGHHDDLQVGALRLLDLQCAASEMSP